MALLRRFDVLTRIGFRSRGETLPAYHLHNLSASLSKDPWTLTVALLHESELACTDPDPQILHRPMRYDIGPPSPVI